MRLPLLVVSTLLSVWHVLCCTDVLFCPVLSCTVLCYRAVQRAAVQLAVHLCDVDLLYCTAEEHQIRHGIDYDQRLRDWRGGGSPTRVLLLFEGAATQEKNESNLNSQPLAVPLQFAWWVGSERVQWRRIAPARLGTIRPT